MSITKKEIEKYAFLSRIELTEEEKESYIEHMNTMLDYIGIIHELDTENVEPTINVLPIYNVMREDTVKDSLPVEAVLANASEKENGQFKVPKIV